MSPACPTLIRCVSLRFDCSLYRLSGKDSSNQTHLPVEVFFSGLAWLQWTYMLIWVPRTYLVPCEVLLILKHAFKYIWPENNGNVFIRNTIVQSPFGKQLEYILLEFIRVIYSSDKQLEYILWEERVIYSSAVQLEYILLECISDIFIGNTIEMHSCGIHKWYTPWSQLESHHRNIQIENPINILLFGNEIGINRSRSHRCGYTSYRNNYLGLH